MTGGGAGVLKVRIPLPGLEPLTHSGAGVLAGLRDQVSGKSMRRARSLVIVACVPLSLESSQGRGKIQQNCCVWAGSRELRSPEATGSLMPPSLAT